MSSAPTTHSAPIHFIWIGGLISDKQITFATSGPMSCAYVYPERKITLWLSESSLTRAAEIFRDFSNIELRSIEGFMRGDYEGGLKYLTGISLEYVFNHFAHIQQREKDNPKVNAYRATMLKDLMSMALLFEYGGYFFDTTTIFFLPGRLEDSPTPKMPCLVDIDRPDRIIAEGFDPITVFDTLDIWAMYTPKPQDSFLKIALSKLAPPEVIRPHRVVTAGGALLDAFKATYSEKEREKYLWQAKEIDEKARIWEIETLGMRKKNASSWRSPSLEYPIESTPSSLVFRDHSASQHPSSAGARAGVSAPPDSDGP